MTNRKNGINLVNKRNPSGRYFQSMNRSNKLSPQFATYLAKIEAKEKGTRTTASVRDSQGLAGCLFSMMRQRASKRRRSDSTTERQLQNFLLTPGTSCTVMNKGG